MQTFMNFQLPEEAKKSLSVRSIHMFNMQAKQGCNCQFRNLKDIKPWQVLDSPNSTFFE